MPSVVQGPPVLQQPPLLQRASHDRATRPDCERHDRVVLWGLSVMCNPLGKLGEKRALASPDDRRSAKNIISLGFDRIRNIPVDKGIKVLSTRTASSSVL